MEQIQYLSRVQQQALQMKQLMMKQLITKRGITEELKLRNRCCGLKMTTAQSRSGGSNSPRSDLHRIEQTIELADYSDEEQDELFKPSALCIERS